MPMRYNIASRPFVFALFVFAFVFALNRSAVPQEPAKSPSAPAWTKLRSAYDFDGKPAGSVKVEPKDDAEYLLQHISFTNARGSSIPGLFLRPKAEGVYPCVLLLHGWTSSKEVMMERFGKALAAKGIASLALDAEHHGERNQAAVGTQVF